MSNEKKNDEAPQDNADDGGDVTEIVPSVKPEEDDEGGSDETQILPMRSSTQPATDLPGTVIGVVGSQSTTPAPHQSDTSEQPPDPATDANDDAATKILIDAPAKESAEKKSEENEASFTVLPSSDVENLSDDPQSEDARQDAKENEVTNKPGEDSPPESEKTVFLAPISKSKKQDDFNPPVGWLVVVDGPGRGQVLDIRYGQNTIGRGKDQHICLNFGDTQISRETHAYVLYDEVERMFFLRDAGQKNLVRLNKKPVMTPSELNSHDLIQIGQTTCLFVPLCNDVFDWLGGEDDPSTGPAEDGNTE